jgi:hypothetical protein
MTEQHAARDLDELSEIVATIPRKPRPVGITRLGGDIVLADDFDVTQERGAQELDNLGKMSADAVRAQYEAAAKAFEVMGEEVKDRIDKLEASLNEGHASMKLLAEAAAAIREQGKLAHLQIAEMSGVTKHINTMCAEVMKKVAGK